MSYPQFENYIMQCCKAEEFALRKFLKRILPEAGFTLQEDKYRSHRTGKFAQIPNLLAIRGNPKVCLVAHTDVCRDHLLYNVETPTPVIKNVSTRRIIQDKECRTQLGGDDRLGVAINTYIGLNTGYDLGLLFTTDEEVGAVSATHINLPDLKKFEILVEVDRGNRSNQLVNQIGKTILCNYETANKLLTIAEKTGYPRKLVNGLLTDVMALRDNNSCKQACNMTCGYHNSVGADGDEYIDIEEARQTLKFVSEIVKHYDLEDYWPDYKITFPKQKLAASFLSPEEEEDDLYY